jgi:hypothetical protein
VLVCSLQYANTGGNLSSLFFPCCLAADEPVLRDNEALRKKCLVPIVSFMSLSCCIFRSVFCDAQSQIVNALFCYAEWYRDDHANHCWRLHGLLLFCSPRQELWVYLPWTADSSQSKLVMIFLQSFTTLGYDQITFWLIAWVLTEHP